MTTNKPEVVAYSWQCHGRHSTVDKKFADELVADGEVVDPLIRLSDYETLQAELETVKKVAYGNIELLERNEALQAELARELQRRFDGNEQASREHRSDVKALVEALELARRTLAMAALEGEVTRRIDSALAAHRKQGSEQGGDQ